MRSARLKTTRMSCSISTIVSALCRCSRRISAGHLIGFLLAHSRGRLVEQQQPRLQRERHGDLGGALVAVRQLADQPVGLARSARPAPGPRRCRSRTRMRRAGRARDASGSPAHFDRDAHVLAHRELGEDFGDLKGARHAHARRARRGESRVTSLAVEQDLARASAGKSR